MGFNPYKKIGEGLTFLADRMAIITQEQGTVPGPTDFDIFAGGGFAGSPGTRLQLTGGFGGEDVGGGAGDGGDVYIGTGAAADGAGGNSGSKSGSAQLVSPAGGIGDTGGAGGNSGNVGIATGDGGEGGAAGGQGGNSGHLFVEAGNGGNGGGGTGQGGNGGLCRLGFGNGGDGGGVGGQTIVGAGDGGASNGNQNGGEGGRATIEGGFGGDGSGAFTPGDGGATQVLGGNAGAGDATDGGVGGAVLGTAGRGGDGQVGGAGGALTLNAGAAGAGTVGDGGVGGHTRLSAGQGGAASGGANTSGSGGDVLIGAGDAGTVSGGATPGLGGSVYIDAGNSDTSGSVVIGDTNAEEILVGREDKPIAFVGLPGFPAYTTGGRPSAASVAAGTTIYNSTTGFLNWSNGTSWSSMPAVVANASDTQMTTTGATTVVTYTPLAQGNFWVDIYYRVVTGATTVTLALTYTDGSGAQTNTLVNLVATAVGSYAVSRLYINATTAAITVTATASVANRLFVSSTITGV